MGTRALVESLIHSEFVVDSEKAQIAKALQEFLSKSKKFKKDKPVIVMLGSSIHGGSVVRRVFAPEFVSDSDFDFGVIVDKEFSSDHLEDAYFKVMMKEIRKFMKKTSTYEPCSYLNAENFHTGNIKNVAKAKEIILLAIDVSASFYDNGLLFFQPSYPSEINEHNRSLILEALREIALENEDLWSRAVSSIMRTWRKVHSLNQKHFRSSIRNKKNDTIAWNLAMNSGTVMSIAMENLLNSTRKG